jgi:hypothetical protein
MYYARSQHQWPTMATKKKTKKIRSVRLACYWRPVGCCLGSSCGSRATAFKRPRRQVISS